MPTAVGKDLDGCNRVIYYLVAGSIDTTGRLKPSKAKDVESNPAVVETAIW